MAYLSIKALTSSLGFINLRKNVINIVTMWSSNEKNVRQVRFCIYGITADFYFFCFFSFFLFGVPEASKSRSMISFTVRPPLPDSLRKKTTESRHGIIIIIKLIYTNCLWILVVEHTWSACTARRCRPEQAEGCHRMLLRGCLL